MKVLFVSDIHGSFYYTKVLKDIFRREEADKIVILGDLYYHGPRNDLSLEYIPMKTSEVLNSLKQYLYVVRGNCDSEVDEQISDFTFNDSLLLNFCNKKIYCTHGHRYNIDNIPNCEFDIMAYGHFHTGFIKKLDEHIFINPGSLSLPKNGSANSYIILDERSIKLKDIEGNIIDKLIF